MNIVILENVKKIYKLGKTEVKALSNINLEIKKQEFVGIIGPSGSGKTTLLNLIGGIDVPTEGRVIVNNQDISKLSDFQQTMLRRKHIGFIFQSFNLIPVLTAYENVELPLIALGYNKQDRISMVNDILSRVGISEFSHHKPDELSGGQRQRVAISRALVIKPDIVLADEPTANLDSETGSKIVEVMKHMNETMNTTFIISTHDPRLLSYMDRKIFLQDGKIVDVKS
ncbi:MAG: ABC transporter ATP-binding protein [Endomicrobiia bacterium]